MYSYPNYIPLDAHSVQRIVDTIEPYTFDRIYGGFHGRTVATDAKKILRRSAERFLRAMPRSK
jgi:hypothetical protein